MAIECHEKSAIFRRTYNNLKEIIRRAREIVGPFGEENKSEKVYTLYRNGGLVEFGAVQYESDKKNWQGRPHDLKAFDEITEFTESQYQFITGWNRSVDSGQRVRVIATGNPPTDDVGSWVLRRWGPWLDPGHPKPAAPGELRYFATVDGEEVEFASKEPVTIDGEVLYPQSRTFIPATLDDNPFYSQDPRYRSKLQALPEPLRSQLLYGDFAASAAQDPWQAIPTQWVRAAQARWIGRQDKPNYEVSAVGVDPSRGGRDNTAIVFRHDNWFSDPYKIPGSEAKDGPTVAEAVRQLLGKRRPPYINVDVIGIGSSVFDSLKGMYGSDVYPINASGRSNHYDRSGMLKMRNKRAEYYWKMREALDPEHGDDIQLPPGHELAADLCAARYEVTASGVIIEPKIKIKERLGRSPDVGEAVMMAFLEGETIETMKNPFYN